MATFQIESVAEINLGTIRVKFSRPPLQSYVGGSNDATNPALYSIWGPAAITVKSCSRVRGDAKSIDLALSSYLSIGTWTLTVGDVRTYDSVSLTPPVAATFYITSLSMLEGVNRGAITDTAADHLRRHTNPVLRGKVWDAIIEALATGDQNNLDNAKKAFDQLFIVSASGSYLTERAGDQGVKKPADLGISDSRFREFVVRTTNKKITEESLLEVLEVFYGTDAVMGWADASLPEPYALAEGYELSVLVDELTTVTTTFLDADFANPAAAKAVEVAAALNRSFRLNRSAAYSLPITDAETGATNVRIYAGSRGLSSAVRVTGGQAQTIFQFQELLPTHTLLPVWDLVLDPATDRLRFTPDSNFDVSLVQVGDYVTVYGGVFDAANRGTYTVVEVYYAYGFGGPYGGPLIQWFEVENRDAVNQATVATASVKDLMVFRPIKNTVHNTPERAVIVSSIGDVVRVTLPATSSVVNREELLAAYLHAGAVSVISPTTLIRRADGVVTVDTVAAHNLSVGDWVMIDGVYPRRSDPPIEPAGTGYTERSLGSIWGDPGAGASAGKVRAATCLLGDGRALIAGGYNPATTDYQTVTPTNACYTVKVDSLAEIVDGEFRANTTIAAVANLSSARAGCGISVGNSASGSLSGKALITGGIISTYNAVATCAIFNPATDTWAAATSLGGNRWCHGQSTLPASLATHGGKVFVTGGVNSVNGGFGPLNTPVNTTTMYTPSTNTWTAKAAMATARYDHAQVVLPDGRVMVIGGRNGTGADIVWGVDPADLIYAGTSLSLCEIYDPGSDTWTATGCMALTRFRHQAVVLADGQVLVVGGYGHKPNRPATDYPLIDAEIWNPVTGAWRPAGRTSVARAIPLLQLMSNGKVMVCGSGTTKTEIYDPKTGRWSFGGGTALNRYDAQLIPMANDLALQVGGYDQNTATADSLLRLRIPAADAFAAGGLNGIFKVTEIASSTSFKFETPGNTSYTRNDNDVDAVVTAMAATSD